MIEKNFEVMPSLSTDSEKELEEKNLLDCIDKEKKDKKNGHGEDISIRMFNIFPELYSKHTASDAKNNSSVTKNNRTGTQNTALHEMLQNRQKRHAIFSSAPKMNGNDVSQEGGKLLSSYHFDPTEVMAVNISAKITQRREDDAGEQQSETTKNPALSGQLKNDAIPLRQELTREDIQPRGQQSSVAQHMLPAYVGGDRDGVAAQKQSLNLKYPFLRWAGEHSVKVSIPTDLSPARHLSLLPSDTRAAEMLSRQVSQLSGFTTELLHPQHNDEESERRDGQYIQEEEQE